MRHHSAGRGHPSHGVLVQGRGRSTVVHVSFEIEKIREKKREEGRGISSMI